MRSSALPDTLPMLDLALFDAEGQERDVFLARLRLAAHDIGFFYLTGHGIDPDLLRQVQNGYLRATVHRVVSPPAERERLSIAFFLGAQLDAVVPIYPLPLALSIEAPGAASDPDNPLLRDVGWNYLKGRLRSHPDVAERYYSDLLWP